MPVLCEQHSDSCEAVQTRMRFIRFAYRPFDTRWLYWDTGRGLLGRPSPDWQAAHVFEGKMWLVLNRTKRGLICHLVS